MAGVALTLDQSLVLTDDVLGNGQSQPGAVRAAADHWKEQSVLQLGGDARAVVDNFDFGHQSMADMADGELAHGPGTQADAAQAQLVLAANGLHGVTHNIEHGLNHLFTVDQQVGQARVVVAHQRDAALCFGLDQIAHPLQHFMHIGHGQRWQLVGAQHAIYQITQAIGFFDDDVGVVPQAFIG